MKRALLHFFNLPRDKVYVKLEDQYRYNLFKTLLKKYKNSLLLAKKLNVCRLSLQKWQRGEYYLSMDILLSLSKLSRNNRFSYKNIEKHIVAIKTGKRFKTHGSTGQPIFNIKFPIFLTPALSRIMAKMFGDGCIKTKWYFETSYCNKQLELINSIKKDMQEVFGDFDTNISIDKRPNKKVLYIRFPPIIGLCLVTLCGSFYSKESRVPGFLLNSSSVIQRNFIKAFFDDEGTIDSRSNNIKIYSSNIYLLNSIKCMLCNLDIGSTKIYYRKYRTSGGIDKRCYTLAVCNKVSVLKFAKEIGSEHKLKKEKLYKIIKLLHSR